jgi:hypothetical protein
LGFLIKTRLEEKNNIPDDHSTRSSKYVSRNIGKRKKITFLRNKFFSDMEVEKILKLNTEELKKLRKKIKERKKL